MKAFKAYDIRGVWGDDLTPELVYKVGFFLPSVLKSNKVLVGRDIRLSSDEVFNNLAKGICDAGADVYDAGITTTPMIYWGSGKFDFPASVMITASHNPGKYNGLKVSGQDVMPVAYDNGLNIIEKYIEDEHSIVLADKKGEIKSFTFVNDYLIFLKSYTRDTSNLSIAIDCSDGMAGLLVNDVFGNKPQYINDKPDGNFPAHEPNPLVAENRQDIENMVKAGDFDIGIIFDGDADRVMFVDEKGKFISPDLIIALLGYYFFEQRGETGKVVQDIRTSKAVSEFLQKYNTVVDIWRVGRAFGASKLKEVDGIYGGELAGHYYFRDFYYSDSGMLAAILVLNIISDFKAKGVTFSDLISRISSYANTGEVNFVIEQKEKAMNEVVEYFKKNDTPEKLFDFDGYRLEFSDWWFNLRPSNTEPYLRFLAEARYDDLLKQKTDIIYNILKKYT